MVLSRPRLASSLYVCDLLWNDGIGWLRFIPSLSVVVSLVAKCHGSSLAKWMSGCLSGRGEGRETEAGFSDGWGVG